MLSYITIIPTGDPVAKDIIKVAVAPAAVEETIIWASFSVYDPL